MQSRGLSVSGVILPYTTATCFFRYVHIESLRCCRSVCISGEGWLFGLFWALGSVQQLINCSHVRECWGYIWHSSDWKHHCWFGIPPQQFFLILWNVALPTQHWSICLERPEITSKLLAICFICDPLSIVNYIAIVPISLIRSVSCLLSVDLAHFSETPKDIYIGYYVAPSLSRLSYRACLDITQYIFCMSFITCSE